jgi:hypothetical protein
VFNERTDEDGAVVFLTIVKLRAESERLPKWMLLLEVTGGTHRIRDRAGARRDAVGLAKPLRAGELTTVWVPDERHEAMRCLSRTREAARKDLKGKRQQVLLIHASARATFPGKKTWGPALMLQKLEHREQRIVLEELLGAVRPRAWPTST